MCAHDGLDRGCERLNVPAVRSLSFRVLSLPVDGRVRRDTYMTTGDPGSFRDNQSQTLNSHPHPLGFAFAFNGPLLFLARPLLRLACRDLNDKPTIHDHQQLSRRFLVHRLSLLLSLYPSTLN